MLVTFLKAMPPDGKIYRQYTDIQSAAQLGD